MINRLLYKKQQYIVWQFAEFRIFPIAIGIKIQN
jgi:hypothetical protein